MGAWQLIAGTSAYKFETGKSVLYWAANAAAFFFYLGGKLIRAARWCIFSRRLDVFSTLFAYGLLRAMWHLAFSPFAGHARLDVALAAVIVVLLDLEKRSRRSMIAT